MDLHKKRFGQRLDTEERLRKKEARAPHELSRKAQTLTGLKVIIYNYNFNKAKLFNKERFKEKIRMKKLMNA